MSISSANRQRIRERANFLCEYCHSSEEASASLFTLDHIFPKGTISAIKFGIAVISLALT